MTYLELTKKVANIDLIICLLNEFGMSNQEIMDKMKITEPTIYNAQKRLETITEALKTIAGEEPKDLRNKDVQAVVEAFKESFGTTTTSRYDRFAAKRLSDKHGTDNIVKIIKVLAQHTGDKYTPSVNGVRQIEEKWVNIAAFFKRMQAERPIDL
jgi:transposase